MDSITKAMTGLTLDADALRTGMDSLPQELWDQIYNDVFTEPGGVRDLTDYNSETNRRQRNLLHVSTNSREQYATTYFRATFVFPSVERPGEVDWSGYNVPKDDALLKWLRLMGHERYYYTNGGRHSVWCHMIRKLVVVFSPAHFQSIQAKVKLNRYRVRGNEDRHAVHITRELRKAVSASLPSGLFTSDVGERVFLQVGKQLHIVHRRL